jgi:cytokinesis protein
LNEWKRSREKNIQFEEQRRRNEASMKRKHAQLKAQTITEAGPASPTSTGAMDSLLEKLRAAAPQARDQRDRRRRARLKDRHQVRVASGQKIPDFNEIPEAEEGLQTKEATIDEEGNPISPGLSSPREGDDDVADRAAALLQGMRGGDGADDDDSEKRESIRKARRQTAEEERRLRRRRREKTTSKDGEDGAAASTQGDEDPAASATTEAGMPGDEEAEDKDKE